MQTVKILIDEISVISVKEMTACNVILPGKAHISSRKVFITLKMSLHLREELDILENMFI